MKEKDLEYDYPVHEYERTSKLGAKHTVKTHTRGEGKKELPLHQDPTLNTRANKVVDWAKSLGLEVEIEGEMNKEFGSVEIEVSKGWKAAHIRVFPIGESFDINLWKEKGYHSSIKSIRDISPGRAFNYIKEHLGIEPDLQELKDYEDELEEFIYNHRLEDSIEFLYRQLEIRGNVNSKKQIIQDKIAKISKDYGARISNQIDKLIGLLEWYDEDKRVQGHIENLKGIKEIKNPVLRERIYNQERGNIKIKGKFLDEALAEDIELEEPEEEKEITFTSLGLKRKKIDMIVKPIRLLRIPKITLKPLEFDSINLTGLTHKTHDVGGSSYTILTGPITRAGSFDYVKNGRKITVYKDWNNIKEMSKHYDYIPIRASTGGGSHFSQVHGFAYNFEPHEDTQELFAEMVLLDDIRNLTPILNPEGGYHMSLGFEDEIIGDAQIIKGFDHVALSLDNSEIGRCTTGRSKGGATGCTAQIKKIHDQNQ